MMRLLLLGLSLLALSACKTTRVSYDDPAAIEPMSTGFSLSDLYQVSDTMVNSMLTSPVLAGLTGEKRPILLVDRIQNRTDQHIDTESITDTIRTQLIQSGRFRFTDKTTRDAQAEEMHYQNFGGAVGAEYAIEKGRQLGAQYLLVGSIVSYEERTKDTLRKSYKMTLNLIDLETGIIEWAQEKPLTKVQSKGAFRR